MIYDNNYKLIFVHIPKSGGTSIKSALSKELGRPKLQGKHWFEDMHLNMEQYSEIVEKDKNNIDDYFKFSIVRNPWDRFASIYHFFIVNLGKEQPFASFGWSRIGKPIPENIMKKVKTGVLTGRDSELYKDAVYNKANYKPLEFDEFIYKVKDNFYSKTPKDLDCMVESPIVKLWTKTQLNFLTIDNKVIVDNFCKFENLQKDFNNIADKIGIKNLQELPHRYKREHIHYTKMYNDTTKKIVEELYNEDIEYFGYKFI